MRSLFRQVRHFYRQRFFRWIDKQVPATNCHRLNRKNLFIFPSRRGVIFMGLIAVLWLLGTNYQNNLILGLAFFLISAFIVTILQTHSNLSGLTIELIGAEPCFAGDNMAFVLALRASGESQHIHLQWQACALMPCTVEVSPGTRTSVSVPFPSHQRGWLQPGRLKVYSYFPLGLMRCWCYLNFPFCGLVYPAPREVAPPISRAVQQHQNAHEVIMGEEDFNGLADYYPGAAMKHIYWKRLASERGLSVKQFSQTASDELWLDLRSIEGSNTEQRLSAMCYWALQFQEQDRAYGVQLGDTVLPPASGEGHRRDVLQALALFGCGEAIT